MKLLAVLLVASAVYTTTSAGSGTLCKLCLDFVTDIQTAINQDVPDLEKVRDCWEPEIRALNRTFLVAPGIDACQG